MILGAVIYAAFGALDAILMPEQKLGDMVKALWGG